MIQLLFTVLAAEVGTAAVLLFKTPLRKLAMLALDRLKRGRAPVMVRTVAATVLVVLASSLHSMAKIHGHAGAGELDAPGALSPTDQVLLARHLLEASLMGTYLCLPTGPARPSSPSCLFFLASIRWIVQMSPVS